MKIRIVSYSPVEMSTFVSNDVDGPIAGLKSAIEHSVFNDRKRLLWAVFADDIYIGYAKWVESKLKIKVKQFDFQYSAKDLEDMRIKESDGEDPIL